MKYSKNDVVRAGKMLAGVMPDDPTLREEQQKTFKVAYGWLFSHVREFVKRLDAVR